MEEMESARVYAKADEQGRLIALEGELTLPEDLTGWVLISRGEPTYERLHAQTAWLPLPVIDDDGVCNYRLDGALISERSEEEKAADRPAPVPTDLERIEAQVLFTALMTDTLITEA